MNEPLSQINSQLTKAYLTEKKENQYFERKGIGKKDTKPSKEKSKMFG